MALTGRSMRGMVYVHTDGLQEDHQLAEWVGMAVGFAEQLPAK